MAILSIVALELCACWKRPRSRAPRPAPPSSGRTIRTSARYNRVTPEDRDRLHALGDERRHRKAQAPQVTDATSRMRLHPIGKSSFERPAPARCITTPRF